MSHTFGLLERIGIELEYMVVDQETLQVSPIIDSLFEHLNGEPSDLVRGSTVDWSNELVAHVLEFKNALPHLPHPQQLCASFAAEVKRANRALEEFGCMLMPTSMHPLMNPNKETRLWPLGNRDIYETFDRIFTCTGHGWSNVQSLHINLSFSSKEEFHRLHSAIRLVLPLIPALAASSPLVEGNLTGTACNRLLYYMANQMRLPSISGLCIPEPIESPEQYRSEVLAPMFQDIAPLDTECLLQEEWLNSRGAIPKFELGCIEIRISDVQEHPKVDLALAEFWTLMIRHLCDRNSSEMKAGDEIPTAALKQLLDATIQKGENAVLALEPYLGLWGSTQPKTEIRALDLLSLVYDEMRLSISAESRSVLEHILSHGTLSARIARGVGSSPTAESIKAVYRELARCLAEERLYDPAVSLHV